MKRLQVSKKDCVGCRVCEAACAAERYGEFNYKRARLRAPESYPVPAAPVFCRHCKNPACISACANQSISLSVDGMVTVNPETCTKCMSCSKACPFSAVFVDAESGLPLICDACGKCVDFCPTQALSIIG